MTYASNNACCPWSEFSESLRGYWRCKAPINWQRAYSAWRKYSATPGEFANGCLREERLREQVTRVPPTVSVPTELK